MIYTRKYIAEKANVSLFTASRKTALLIGPGGQINDSNVDKIIKYVKSNTETVRTRYYIENTLNEQLKNKVRTYLEEHDYATKTDIIRLTGMHNVKSAIGHIETAGILVYTEKMKVGNRLQVVYKLCEKAWREMDKNDPTAKYRGLDGFNTNSGTNHQFQTVHIWR